jgi:hypothetical protein
MSKSEIRQKSIPITMPKITISTVMVTIPQERITIDIPEMLADTH